MDNLDVRTLLSDYLLQEGVLNYEEYQAINSEVIGSSKASKTFLSMLSYKTEDQFDKFLDALDNTEQGWIRDHITGRQGYLARDIVCSSVKLLTINNVNLLSRVP